MRYLSNSNQRDCDHSPLGDGSCCCNCVNRYKAIHPVMGFVGYVCRLRFDKKESHVKVLTHEHGMCEMYWRVSGEVNMSVEDIEDSIGQMEIVNAR